MTINHRASVTQCTSDDSLPVQTPSAMTINHGAPVNHSTSDVSLPVQLSRRQKSTTEIVRMSSCFSDVI